MRENEFLSWLADRFRSSSPNILVGTGLDDCAHIDCSEFDKISVSTDMLLEGTHFNSEHSPFAIGQKAVLSNLSDLAASGCRPVCAVIAVGLRRHCGDMWARDLANGMAEAAEKFNLAIVGGDTTSGDGPTSISITVLGIPISTNPLLRSSAQADDIIAVTGMLGGSLLKRHLTPIPRLKEIEWILAQTSVHACMDLSDGLSADLPRMMTASQTGARIQQADLPISSDAKKIAQMDQRPDWHHALDDGEDFELLMTFSSSAWQTVAGRLDQIPNACPVTKIGTVTADPEILLEMSDGSIVNWPTGGYQHEF